MLTNNMNKWYISYMEILSMPHWKSRILRMVAWILGMRGEHVYCITMNVDLNDPKQAKELLKRN